MTHRNTFGNIKSQCIGCQLTVLDAITDSEAVQKYVDVQPSDHFLPINRVKLHFLTFLGQLLLLSPAKRNASHVSAVNFNAFYLTSTATDVHYNALLYVSRQCRGCDQGGRRGR